MFCVVLVCLIVMCVMYGRIMRILCQYQPKAYSTASQRKAQRHIRGLFTSMIILKLFALLWLPSCIMDAYTALRMYYAPDQVFKVFSNVDKVTTYLYALVIANAILDPIVYAMRMKDIQKSLRSLLRFKRPTFSNKMNGFTESLHNRSSNGSIPLRYVQRQYSTNSTNTTVYSGISGNSVSSDRPAFSRKSTLTSQGSITEDTPLTI